MPPMPNDEHQQMVMRIGSILQEIIGWPGLGEIRAGINLSDREEGWEHNYRVPDLVTFLHGGPARNCGTHWCGGPDFIVEITSPDDRTRDKLPFYQDIGVRELLLIDRDPWALEVYVLRERKLIQGGRVTLDQPGVLSCIVLPLTFELLPGRIRPLVAVTHRETQHRWLV